jgi:hypothetical protein
MIALPDFLLAKAELLWSLSDRPERLLWRPEIRPAAIVLEE